jgi:hypothetical protein
MSYEAILTYNKLTTLAPLTNEITSVLFCYCQYINQAIANT